MKVSEAKHFLTTLNTSNKQGHYLTVHGTHEYSVITGDDAKANKALNTAKIADAMEECFEALKSGDISMQQRTEIMTKLKTQIKYYNSRVYKSKSFFKKVGSAFGCVSAGEKKINSIAKQVRTEIKTNDKALKEFQNIHGNFKARKESKLAGEMQQKKVYMRVFSGVGSEAVRNEKLEGFSQSGGIKSFIDDLTRYEASLDESKVGLKTEIKEKIELLKNAYSISALHEHANSKHVGADDKEILMRELQLRVSEEIQHLAENGKVGEQILIPGGYEKAQEGHAVLYQITKTGANQCSFTIINAGDGAKEAMSATGIGSSLVNMFSEAVFDSKLVREKVQDIKYENVKFEALGLPFLKDVFEQQFHKDQKNPMQVIKDRINTSLMKGSVRKTTGREHSSQEIGSCTFKSVSSWLKGSFTSVKEYNKFKAAHTEWDLKELQDLLDQKAKTVNETKYTQKGNQARELKEKQRQLNQLNAMSVEGQRVLRKRKNKAV